jgi:hypothetical protein
VPDVAKKPSYGGYMDIVMHGDQEGTQSYVDGRATDFSLEQTAQLVEQSPSWNDRPVRLLSCSTGQEDYAQRLADRLQVPVYAPSDVLQINPDGSSEIWNDGTWKRFEPVVK